MSSNTQIGRSIDITNLLDLFEAKEGDVEHIIGKTGQGKTYEATRRALKYLQQGNIVYTTWRLTLPDVFDERTSPWHVLKNIILFRKNFFRFDYKKNWHFVNLDEYLDEEGIFDTEKFARFLASRTDCIFMLDEGQDTFDSHQRAGKIARQSITRTRHMHKKLIIISQRAQAVDVNARGNVTWFYKCESVNFPFLPKFFRVRMTDEIDESNNYPIWVRHDSTGEKIWEADVYHSGFARKEVYAAYDSWYMRKNMQKSQDIHLQGYEVSFKDRVKLFTNLVFSKGKLSTHSEETVDKKDSLFVRIDRSLFKDGGWLVPSTYTEGMVGLWHVLFRRKEAKKSIQDARGGNGHNVRSNAFKWEEVKKETPRRLQVNHSSGNSSSV